MHYSFLPELVAIGLHIGLGAQDRGILGVIQRCGEGHSEQGSEDDSDGVLHIDGFVDIWYIPIMETEL